MTRKNVTNESNKPKLGRPITRKVEIHATAEEIAKAMFAAADLPDPSKRIVKRPRKGQRTNFSVISGRLWDRILLFLTWDGVRAKPERRPRKHRRSSLGSERGTPCGGGVPHNKLDRSSCVFSAINRSHCGPVEIGEFVYK